LRAEKKQRAGTGDEGMSGGGTWKEIVGPAGRGLFQPWLREQQWGFGLANRYRIRYLPIWLSRDRKWEKGNERASATASGAYWSEVRSSKTHFYLSVLVN
jgi:hypothetical protein